MQEARARASPAPCERGLSLSPRTGAGDLTLNVEASQEEVVGIDSPKGSILLQ